MPQFGFCFIYGYLYGSKMKETLKYGKMKKEKNGRFQGLSFKEQNCSGSGKPCRLESPNTARFGGRQPTVLFFDLLSYILNIQINISIIKKIQNFFELGLYFFIFSIKH